MERWEKSDKRQVSFRILPVASDHLSEKRAADHKASTEVTKIFFRVHSTKPPFPTIITIMGMLLTNRKSVKME